MRHLDDGRIQEWLDRERSGMDPGDRAAVERHLARCADCGARADELSALSARTGDLLAAAGPEGSAVPDFEGVRLRADRVDRAGARRRTWARGAWAASIAAALAVGWGVSDAARRDGPAAGDLLAPAGAAERTAGSSESAGRAGPDTPAAERPPPSVVSTRVAASQDQDEDSTPDPVVLAADAVAAFDAPPVADTIAASAGGASGHTPTTLRGRVSDAEGAPLGEAQVFVEGTSIGALTDAAGRFVLELDSSLASVEAPPLTLTAQRIGYRTEQRQLEPGTDTDEIELSLDQQALALEGVVVTGTASPTQRRAVTASVSNVTVADTPGSANGPIAWTPTDRATAEPAAGVRLLELPESVPGLVALGTVAGVRVARLALTLPDGTVVTLYQAATPVALPETVVPEGHSVATDSRDEGWVALAGPLTRDQLRRLLERTR